VVQFFLKDRHPFLPLPLSLFFAFSFFFVVDTLRRVLLVGQEEGKGKDDGDDQDEELAIARMTGLTVDNFHSAVAVASQTGYPYPSGLAWVTVHHF
jgi:hypothetical protein